MGDNCKVECSVDGPYPDSMVCKGETVDATFYASNRSDPDVHEECAIGDDDPEWRWYIEFEFRESKDQGWQFHSEEQPGFGGTVLPLALTDFGTGHWKVTATVVGTWTGSKVDENCQSCPSCGNCEKTATASIKFTVWELDTLTVVDAADSGNSATDSTGSGAAMTILGADEEPAEVVLFATFKPYDLDPGEAEWEVKGDVASPSSGDFSGTPTVALDPQSKGQVVFRVLAGCRLQGGQSLGLAAMRFVDVAVADYQYRVVLSKCPRSFLPEGGPFSGSDVVFTARVELAEGTSEGAEVKGRFKFRLSDVSDEPGYCLNHGDSAEDDLAFNEGYNGVSVNSNGQIAETILDSLTIAKAEVDCSDYGAYGKIQAWFQKDGVGEWRRAKVQGTNDTEASIPIDENENHIADAYEHDTSPDGTDSSTDDDDSSPVGIHPGDGLSRYEEYRGFSISGQHTRTSPLEKDVFYHDASGVLPDNYWNSANLGAPIHDLASDEFDTALWITFNSKTSKLDGQKTIRQTAYLAPGERNFFWGSPTGGRRLTAGTV